MGTWERKRDLPGWKNTPEIAERQLSKDHKTWDFRIKRGGSQVKIGIKSEISREKGDGLRE